MSCYLLAQLSIHDRPRYDAYARALAATLERYDARVLVAQDGPAVLEGSWPHDRVVMLEFVDRGQALEWMDSAPYRKIVADRHAAATAVVLELLGLP